MTKKIEFKRYDVNVSPRELVVIGLALEDFVNTSRVLLQADKDLRPDYELARAMLNRFRRGL